MKLYYSAGACSLAAHIVAREAELPIGLVRVDLSKHLTEDGRNYLEINPRGYVPLLIRNDGEVMTEVVALLLYLSAQVPQLKLSPPAGSNEYFKLLQWLGFVSSELHKTVGPWLFIPDAAESTKQSVRNKFGVRLTELDRHLGNQPYLLGEDFSAVDAYAFTVIAWTRSLKIDLTPYPNLKSYMNRVGTRPKVREALVAEGLVQQSPEEAES